MRWNKMVSGASLTAGASTAWLVLIGAAVGAKFPDIDQHTTLLVHRSILTHGLLLPLLLFGLTISWRQYAIRALTIGFGAASAVHLCFDLYPRAWYGHALIHVPGYGWVSPLASQLWIVLSIIGTLYGVCLLLSSLLEIILAGGSAAIGFMLYAHEGVFGPLLTLLGALVIVMVLPDQWAETVVPISLPTRKEE
jgi:hypothetical protein